MTYDNDLLYLSPLLYAEVLLIQPYTDGKMFPT